MTGWSRSRCCRSATCSPGRWPARSARSRSCLGIGARRARTCARVAPARNAHAPAPGRFQTGCARAEPGRPARRPAASLAQRIGLTRMDFLIARDDLHSCRFDEQPVPQLADGQALLRVERFGLTSNNITYAVFGEAMSYWSFFPAPDGWGRMPVWGFAEVSDSRVDELPAGARVRLPAAVQRARRRARADRRQRFVDASPHRAQLPAAYNALRAHRRRPDLRHRHRGRADAAAPAVLHVVPDRRLPRRSLLFGASTAILSSASSKTSSALAFLLSRREGVDVIGLTSRAQRRVRAQPGRLRRGAQLRRGRLAGHDPAVYVDMAGDAQVRTRVHGH